jgi:hypothetical protein
MKLLNPYKTGILGKKLYLAENILRSLKTDWKRQNSCKKFTVLKISLTLLLGYLKLNYLIPYLNLREIF